MNHPRLRIGTRGSALALWQAEWVKSLLELHHPGVGVELVIIKTKGDKILDVPLALVGGKGLFVKELEDALLTKEVDLAVHSMKDVPTELPEGLIIDAILERADPRDVVLAVNYRNLAELPQGARVGSSSLRRQSQLLHLRPDLQLHPLRGNVNTRIAKLVNGEYHAIILAAAGVNRLGLTQQVVETLEPEQMLPAIGQGAVGVELRADDRLTRSLIAPLHHPATARCVAAERALLATLQGGCQVPIAAHAREQEGRLHLEGLVGAVDGSRILRRVRTGELENPVALGEGLARELLAAGGAEILGELYPIAEKS